MKPFQRFLRSLGPGILFASTAIGVSHLVQSTRAGALYGFGLLWAVVAANLFKYPFFEYGSRYASATGESLIEGYRRMGRFFFGAYVLVTVGTMFFVSAAVGAVTGGFLDNLFGLNSLLGEDSYSITLAALFLICVLTLLIGRYKVLDNLIKVIGTVLLLSTLISFFAGVAKGPENESVFRSFAPVFDSEKSGLLFLIALMGWMPTAVDMSTWNSIWTVERDRSHTERSDLKSTLLEFRFGYWVSAILSVCFITLGAYLFFDTGQELPTKSHLFANSVIGLYTAYIGKWSYLLIASAGFSIMFGTCIAVFDGYSRAAARTAVQLFPKFDLNEKRIFSWSLILVGLGSYFICTQFAGDLKSLVDLATTISFIVAPVIAIANFKLVTGKHTPTEAQPGMFLRVLSLCGIVFLTGFSLYYLLGLM